MKKILFLLCLIFSIESTFAQLPTVNMRSTTKSNVEFVLANNGIYAMNLRKNTAGVVWPRGSGHTYIFGGGLWFGAHKRINGELHKLRTLTYNPSSGYSWMRPGQPGDELKNIDTNLYKLYISSDFNTDGSPKNDIKFNWPIWNTLGNVQANGNFGTYIYEPYNRLLTQYPKGPVVISDEDITATYNDTDLMLYENSPANSTALGFPFGMHYEQMLYSWSIGTPLQDVIAIRYRAINTSKDTLYECWIGTAVDPDVAAGYSPEGTNNDRSRYFSERPDLNTMIHWSEETAQDSAKGLGIVAISLIETPVADGNKFLRKDKRVYAFEDQIGGITLNHYYVGLDMQLPSEFYEVMRSGRKAVDNGRGDKRSIITSGSFHMLPGDTTYLTVAFTFAKRDTANENYSELIQKIEAVRDTLFKNAGEEIPEANPENPFIIYNTNSEATLYLSLLKTENVKIEVFNVLGQRMSEVFKGELSAQNHAIPFSTALFPSGAYYCAIVTDGGVEMVPVRIAR